MTITNLKKILMDGSPSEATERQLKELHLKLDIVKKEKA